MKFKVILFFLLAGFSFFLSQNYEKYIVKKGDSYYLIGKKLQINYLDLIKLNRGKKLIAGKVIEIPFYFYHTVKRNESLDFLAKKYLVNVDDILRLNNSKKNLYVGQRLKIPKFVSKIKVTQSAQKDETYNSNQAHNPIPVSTTLEDVSFIWPVNGRVTPNNDTLSSFDNNMNLGISIKTLNNDAIYASENGIVLFQGMIRGFGKVTLISHSGDFITAYMGVKEFYVYANQVVKKGQPIAKSRKRLFFSIFLKGDPQNPTEFINHRSS